MPHFARAVADRIIVIVLDGLRPDHIRPDVTPNILRLAGRGKRFTQARSVFPSMTRVATSSIASGATPHVHGIVGNAFWHFGARTDRPVDTSKFADLRDIAASDPRGVLTAPTFGDALAASGKRMAVVHTGSSGSAFLINPRAKENGHWTFSIHGRDFTQTPEANDAMAGRFGPLPAPELPRFAQMDHGTHVFVEHVLGEMRPDLALIWLPEPDTSYHYRNIGSADSRAALHHADVCVGRILDALDQAPDRDRTAILLLSDHGQITVTDEVPLYERLRSAGFDAATKGEDVAIVGTSGASGEIRFRHFDAALRDRVAEFLAEQPEIGMLFSPARHGGIEGAAPHTLALELLDLQHDRAPDLAFVLRSDESADPDGMPGLGLYMGGVPRLGGMHGGLNRHELATVLIIAAPEIDGGETTDEPAGLPDIAPTILALLGIQTPASMIGRALAGGMADPVVAELETAETACGAGTQRLRRLRHGKRIYLDAGLRD